MRRQISFPPPTRRAFFRVIAFHILLFQLLASLAWTNGDWWTASITLLTHAGLSLIDQYAAFWTQRPAGAGFCA